MAQAGWRAVNAAVDDGTTLATLLNEVIPAIMSTQEGSAPPSGATKGALFVDSSGEAAGGNFVIKMYDGAGWHVLLTINKTTGQVTLPTAPVVEFPAGTRMIFQQSTAPTGWTKDTTQNNKALRITSGNVVAGGEVAFTDVFKGHQFTGTVQGTTLSWNHMPYHEHQSTSGNVAFANAGNLFLYPKGDDPSVGNYMGYGTVGVSGAGGNWAHDHPFVGSVVNLNVQFVDVIIAQKD